ncbi:hypothetical protein Dda_2293 [Drechslerella dactyloides]|uniref:Rhodopsin domain-containing protein n=1 Tax=Drechslerella dactyloides TaxID=74499 RepID=A0AAD6NNS5_DREDA|nr:hypothetical protein Dda_2293 [Drechslerella dactyloides]
MAVDISIPTSSKFDHSTLVKIGIALTYSTPYYRNLTMIQAADNLFARARTNFTAPISDLLGTEFQETEREVPIFETLGQQPGFLVATVLRAHFETLSHASMRDMISVIILQHFVTFCHFFIKSSLLLFYYRLSPKPWFRIAVVVTAVVNAAHTISNFLAVLFSCKPIIWSDALFTAKCGVDRVALSLSGVVIFMFLDVVIVILPIPIVWRLQLKKREKLLTLGLFGLGFFVCFASGMKVARLHALAYDVDTTWQIENFQWTLVELNVGIICACAPALHHLTSKTRLKALYHDHRRLRLFHRRQFSEGTEDREQESSVGQSEKTGTTSTLVPQSSDISSQYARTGIRSGNNSARNLCSDRKILSKDEMEFIEQGLGVGALDIDMYGDGGSERESERNDLTRASSAVMPDGDGDGDGDGGFEIVRIVQLR